MESMERIRNYPKSPNPLFEKWLEEWKEMAAAKNLSIQHSFGKALTSLRKYPLPLASGKDCYILNHFGHKLCSMLDKKLIEHNTTHNPPCNSEQSTFSQNHIKEKQNKSHKTYIPKAGSASYAILIVMYKNTKKPNYPGYMYKSDIMSQVENEYNCSMKKTNSDYYTGWSSMSTLIAKNLILKESNPAKYSLTDTGISLAKLLQKRENESFNSFDDIGLCKDTQSVPSFQKKSPSSLKSKYNSSNSSDNLSNSFKYNEKITKNSTSTAVDELNSIDQILSPTKNVNKADDIIIINDDDDDDDNNDYNNMCLQQKSEDLNINSLDGAKKMPGIENSKCNSDSFQKYCEENAESFSTEMQSEHNVKVVQKSRIENRKRIFTTDEITDKQNKKMIFTDDASSESFYLLPNNFSIILLVDTQETSRSKTKSNNDEKMLELNKNKISYEIRNLKIGDFLWIARCKFTNRELVLPYIVERKRIDDLSSSIKDGRYHEQKYRLKECGIPNITYLIENYGKNYHGAIPLTTLYQAAMNTLVQDDFNVKFTTDHKDSLRYLAVMTTMLTEIYEGKELSSCNKKDLLATNFNILDDSIKLMEFTSFNKSAIKTKNFNVRETFIRQLLQLKGVSVEKALAIVRLYPTPKCITEALMKGDENLLANIEVGATKRKLGHVISKTIYQLYTRHNFD